MERAARERQARLERWVEVWCRGVVFMSWNPRLRCIESEFVFFWCFFCFSFDFCEKPFIYINVSRVAYSAHISRVTPLMKTASNVSAEASS